MKSIILSIRPEWSAKILNGIKTEEIRKNLGKLKPPFKVYAYVTKDSKLQWVNGCLPIRWGQGYRNERLLEKTLNGKICYEFVCDRVDKLEIYDDGCVFIRNQEQCTQEELIGGSCLTIDQMYDYIGYGDDNSEGNETAVAYSLHISELKVYDTPKELGEFHKVGFNEAMKNWEWDRLSPPDEKSILIPCPAPRYEIKKAPQSWQFVEELK